MPKFSSTSKVSDFNDIPDCWKSAKDIPSVEEMVKRIKNDPIFADAFFFQETNDPENALDGTYQPLVDYQGIAFEKLDNNNHIWWQASRGAAKSSTLARWALGRCLRFPKTQVAIFAPSFRQSKMLFNNCLKYLNDNFGVASHIYKLETEIEGEIKVGHEPLIKFKNGSSIQAYPCGDGEKLRGIRANIIVIDEFYQFEKELFTSHIQPIGNVKLAGQETKMVHITTSWYQDCFAYTVLQDIASAIQKGRRGYAIIDVRLDDVIKSGFPYDKDFVLHQLESMSDNVTGKPSDELLMTFFNVWIKSSSNFYPPHIFSDARTPLVSVRDKRVSGDKTFCVGSCDPAGSGSDMCAMAVIGCPGNDKRDLWAAYKYSKLKPEEIAGMIHKMVDKYGMSLVVMDKSGVLGPQIADICSRELQLIDGVWEKREPILLWDHPDARNARCQLIITKPSDERIQHGVAGPRANITVTGELDLKNLFHLQMKRVLENGKFSIPLSVKDSDYYDSERGDIMDNINEAVSQFPKIDTIKLPDGSVKKDTKGNFYFTKPKKDDLAYAVIYANYAASIYYRETEGDVKPEKVPIIWDVNDIQQKAKSEERKHKIEIARLF